MYMEIQGVRESEIPCIVNTIRGRLDRGMTGEFM
jgi:hypothetical protein